MWLTYVEEQLDQGRLPTMAAVREKAYRLHQFQSVAAAERQRPSLSGGR
jgi:hypothetical protein